MIELKDHVLILKLEIWKDDSSIIIFNYSKKKDLLQNILQQWDAKDHLLNKKQYI